MPDLFNPPGEPVFGTGPDYQVHKPIFHSFQMRTYDSTHTYNKAHQPLKVHNYNNSHTYNKLRTYDNVREYEVREYKPRFYSAPKPPPPRIDTPLPPREKRPRTPDYKWAQLYVCYEDPLGPHIPVKDYRCRDYKGRDYKPIMTQYKSPEMDYLSRRSTIYQGNVDYKLTKENYYPFKKRTDIRKARETSKQKEKSVASLKHISFKEEEPQVIPTQQMENREPSTEQQPIRDESPSHPTPLVIAQEKEKTFVNEAEKNGPAVGASVMMVSAATETDDLKHKKRCSRWTQTTPVASPEPSIREMTPVEIVPKRIVTDISNQRSAEIPPKEDIPQPSPLPEPEHTDDLQPPPYNVAPAAVVIGNDHIRQRSPSPPSRRSQGRSPSPRSRSPSPRHRSPSPSHNYRHSPGILPLAGFAAGAVVGGSVVAPVKKQSPTPEPPVPQPKENTPSPKPDSALSTHVDPIAAVVVGGALVKESDNNSKQDDTQPPPPSSPLKKSSSPSPDTNTVAFIPLVAGASPQNQSAHNSSPEENKRTPTPKDITPDDNIVIAPVAVSHDKQPANPSPVKSKTPSPSPSISLPSPSYNSSPSSSPNPPVVAAVLPATAENVGKPATNPKASPASPQNNISPVQPVIVASTEDVTAKDESTPVGSSASRRGLPPEVVAALEAYDNAHKKTFNDQVPDTSSKASRSRNLPPEVAASIEAYNRMRS